MKSLASPLLKLEGSTIVEDSAFNFYTLLKMVGIA